MKKYCNLHEPLIQRIFDEEQNEKAAKTRLHQLYGSYIQPNGVKKAAALLRELATNAGDGGDISERHAPGGCAPSGLTNYSQGVNSYQTENNKDTLKDTFCNSLLKLHSSTSERLPYIHEFYGFIKSVVGEVNTVLDLGCGFNPFSLAFFPWSIKEYHAIDIDTATRDLLNEYFTLVNLPKYASCADLVTEAPHVQTDLALMLKLLPVLESNKPGRGYELANSLNAKWLVITFPTKSLGGKYKGMEKNYTDSFHEASQNNQLDNFTLSAKNHIGSELVFILKNLR